MIASGEKKEEYREIKKHWVRRLILDHTGAYNFEFTRREFEHDACLEYAFYNAVKFTNGYQKNAPSILVECKGISCGIAVPEWSDNWQGDVFIIKLGDIISRS